MSSDRDVKQGFTHLPFHMQRAPGPSEEWQRFGCVSFGGPRTSAGTLWEQVLLIEGLEGPI